MKKPELLNEGFEATYCPEDNKLRLYVGRVPREEYEALRAEGWTSTPKQDCDFAATWTPQRQDTAESYAGFVGDEDQSPQDRAADRAERFAGYREKRIADATGHADTYDAQPSAFGYQNKAKAVRAANRADRHADKALDNWGKAEYWTRRTAGVIANALYKSTIRVRLGRIKKLELELNRFKQSPEYYGRWIGHTELRLAYEKQMADAEGGRAAELNIEPGGLYAGRLVVQVNKSSATGNVVSLRALRKVGDTFEPVARLIDIERDTAGSYQEPTEETLAALAEFKKARAAASKKANAGKPKLINPTREDAERLQKIWNDDAAKHKAKPAEVVEMTQAQYSARAAGSYGPCSTIVISEKGLNQRWRNNGTHKIFKVRQMDSPGFNSPDRVVILTDKPQKPLPWAAMEQAGAEDREAKERAQAEFKHPDMKSALVEAMAAFSGSDWPTDDQRELVERAEKAELVYSISYTQKSWTKEGEALCFKPATA